ncbi:DUF590-domain-containing protein [Pluteus cervinus]|uniref:DUF590-domain-containing protein n=1 Tax=Pluteus cervinus TaxID=181527 RepID=A0ACD3AK08_9AGAR|nr:DUF590-domain-containing protein [Pluteus cervinus]
MSPPEVDLIITFRATRKTSLSKTQTREDARKAEKQYSRLIDTLTYAGLKAVGRRGESLGHLLVFVTCPREHIVNLIRLEREADFLSGLPVTPIRTGVEASRVHLSPADRLRLIYSYVTSMSSDGGLGITPGASEWDLVESVMALHDKEFNESWIRSWNIHEITSVHLDKIREQFGDAVALYFAFLSSYTSWLIFPAVLGFLTHIFSTPYSPVYSLLLLLWSTTFTEWWRVHERVLSLRWGTRGSFRVEKRRAQYKKEDSSSSGASVAVDSIEGGPAWWKRELKILASVPVILGFAAILFALLTGIFVLEAFVTQLYTGPGQKVITLLPTLLFIAVVPRLVGLYQVLARRLTSWENHAHESTYTSSLTLKTFVMSAIVAYGGLALSAFVYVPFGEGLMAWVQAIIQSQANYDEAIVTVDGEDDISKFNVFQHHQPHHQHHPGHGFWEADTSNARLKLNPSRLRDQMFAYTVTNQLVNLFVEIGLPYLQRDVLPKVQAWFSRPSEPKAKTPTPTFTPTFSSKGKSKEIKTPQDYYKKPSKSSNSSAASVSGASVVSSAATPTLKKRVIFEDEQEKGGLEEREFLDRVRAEAALPEYDLFTDYSEMVVQFGYVVLWSGIWCLAPVMALLNNVLELRSDAYKITVHHRRPLFGIRADTIGPWLDALTFLTWLGALCNSSLVYLFCPEWQAHSKCATGTSSYPAMGAMGSMGTFSAAQSRESVVQKVHRQLFSASGATSYGNGGSFPGAEEGDGLATRDLLLTALVIALAASHGYILLRSVIRHIVERVVWRGSVERIERERDERAVRERFFSGLADAGVRGDDVQPTRQQPLYMLDDEASTVVGEGTVIGEPSTPTMEKHSSYPLGGQDEGLGKRFWYHDEGLEEIHRIVKEA